MSAQRKPRTTKGRHAGLPLQTARNIHNFGQRDLKDPKILRDFKDLQHPTVGADRCVRPKKTANNKGQTHRSAPTITRTTTPHRRGWVCPYIQTQKVATSGRHLIANSVSPVWAGKPAPTSVSNFHQLLSNELFTVLDVDATLLGLEDATSVEVKDEVILLLSVNAVDTGCLAVSIYATHADRLSL